MNAAAPFDLLAFLDAPADVDAVTPAAIIDQVLDVDSLGGTLFGPAPADAVADAVAPEELLPVGHRLFVRCTDCLSVAVLDSREHAPAGRSHECACGGRVETMGHVDASGTRWTRTEVRGMCDERCQTATGPHCNCRCGGEHHGDAMACRTVVAASGVVRLENTLTSAQRARGAAYRDALAGLDKSAADRLGAVLADRRAGKWLSRGDYVAAEEWLARRREIVRGRSHASRLSKIAAAAAWLADETPRSTAWLG